MDVNLYCEEDNCISEASAFYFKATRQRRVCKMHLPTAGEKQYPIAQFYFITAPEDEAEFDRRSVEVKQRKEFLEKLLNKATGELKVGIASLDTAKTRALQVVTEVYEAEKRRARQHFHQIEVFIEDFNQELILYLAKKENLLSNPLDNLPTELPVPSLMRLRTLENDLELAQIILSSSSRGELSLDHHLKNLLNPKLRTLVAVQLFRKGQKFSQTDSYLELQKALEDCTESEVLNPLPETTQLKTELKGRLDKMKSMRESELQELISHDTESIRSLLDLHLKSVPSLKAAGEILQLEKLYEKIQDFALPESQSNVTLETLLDFAKWYNEQKHHKSRGLKRACEAALKILTHYKLKSEDTLRTSLHLGKLYQSEENYTTALEHFNAAVAIGRAKFEKSKDTAMAFAGMGMACYKIKVYDDAEDHYEAAIDILDRHFRESIERATVYANLAMLYGDLGRHPEALEKYNISVDILRAHFRKSIQHASILIQQGRWYRRIGKTDEAERCLNEAFEICDTGARRNLKKFQNLKHQILLDYFADLSSMSEDSGSDHEEMGGSRW